MNLKQKLNNIMLPTDFDLFDSLNQVQLLILENMNEKKDKKKTNIDVNFKALKKPILYIIA